METVKGRFGYYKKSKKVSIWDCWNSKRRPGKTFGRKGYKCDYEGELVMFNKMQVWTQKTLLYSEHLISFLDSDEQLWNLEILNGEWAVLETLD